jgi:hypothetical protein
MNLTRQLLNKGFIVVKLKSSLDRGLLLTRKLLNKRFIVVKLKSSLDRGLLLTRKLASLLAVTLYQVMTLT